MSCVQKKVCLKFLIVSLIRNLTVRNMTCDKAAINWNRKVLA